MWASKIEGLWANEGSTNKATFSAGEELLSALDPKYLTFIRLLYIIEATMGFLLTFITEREVNVAEWHDFPRTYLSFPRLKWLADIKSLFLELISKIRTYFEETGMEETLQDLELFQKFWDNCEAENNDIANCLNLFFSEHFKIEAKWIVSKYKNMKGPQHSLEEMEIYYFVGLLLISYVFIKYLLSFITRERIYKQLREYFDQDIEWLKEDPLKVLKVLLRWYRRDPFALGGSNRADEMASDHNEENWPALFQPISLPHDAEVHNGGHCAYWAFISRIVLKDCGITEMTFAITRNHVFVVAKIDEDLYRVDLAKDIVRPLENNDLLEVKFLIKSEWWYLWALFVNEHVYELRWSRAHTVLSSSYTRELDFRNNNEAREFYEHLVEIFRLLIIGMELGRKK